jgi:hypothetical protein
MPCLSGPVLQASDVATILTFQPSCLELLHSKLAASSSLTPAWNRLQYIPPSSSTSSCSTLAFEDPLHALPNQSLCNRTSHTYHNTCITPRVTSALSSEKLHTSTYWLYKYLTGHLLLSTTIHPTPPRTVRHPDCNTKKLQHPPHPFRILRLD